ISARSRGSKSTSAAAEREAAPSATALITATTAAARKTAGAAARSAIRTAILCCTKTFRPTAAALPKLLIDELLNLFTVEVEVVSESRFCGIPQGGDRFRRRILSESGRLNVVWNLCGDFFRLILLRSVRSFRLPCLQCLRPSAAEPNGLSWLRRCILRS